MMRAKIEGLRELDKALGGFTKTVAKNTLQRAGRKALEPVAEMARQLAPDDPKTQGNDLRSSIGVGTRLSRNQARQKRKAVKSGEAEKYFAEVYAGAGALPQAHLREFGLDGAAPHPFLRPAWDANKNRVLETIKADIASEIEKTAKRQAARLAKAKG